MKAALRVISIATAILWIFIGAFIGLTIYSATLMRIEEFSGGGALVGSTFIVQVNVTLSNGGYFDITDIDILTRLYLPIAGVELNRSSTSVEAIRAGERKRISHQFELDMLSLLGRPEVVKVLLLNSTDLELVMSFSLTYALVFTIKVDANTSVPWGAPLSGFKVREYEISHVDAEVHLILNVTFKNDAQLNFNFMLRAFDEHGVFIGESSPISITSDQAFNGTVVIPIPADKWTGKGWVVACVDLDLPEVPCTEVLRYG